MYLPRSPPPLLPPELEVPEPVTEEGGLEGEGVPLVPVEAEPVPVPPPVC